MDNLNNLYNSTLLSTSTTLSTSSPFVNSQNLGNILKPNILPSSNNGNKNNNNKKQADLTMFDPFS